MKRMFRNIICFVLALFIMSNVRAQDIHFSQFFNSPSQVNPALTGFSNSRLRIYLNHKNQWSTVSLPFQTFAAAMDGQLLKRKQKGDILGMGVAAFSDKAGDSHFGTQSIDVSLSYIKALGEYSTRNFIGFGVHAAYVQRSLDYQSLYFDSQYNGVQFNPNLFNGELFAIDNYSYYDISAGVNWFTNINYDIRMQTGLSLWHLNMPLQSLMNNKEVKLPVKAILHVEAEINKNDMYWFLPGIFIQRQGSATEIVIGTKFKYVSSEKPTDYSAFITGLYYRNNDAIITYIGYQYKDFEFGISYDFNISTLHPASKYLGGIELCILYKIPNERHPKPKDLPCPIF